MVDWGDGVVEEVGGNVVANHSYNYSDIPTTGEATLGYRQVIVKVYPHQGQVLSMLNLNQKCNNVAGLASYGSSGWLDMVIDMPSLQVLDLGGGGQVWHRYLERVRLLRMGTVSNIANLFYGCLSLQSVEMHLGVPATNCSGTFNGCQALKRLPLFDTSNTQSFASFAYNCASLVDVPLFDTSKATSTRQMFYSCSLLEKVPLFDLSRVTDVYGMFQNAGVSTVPLFDTHACTAINSGFQNASRLRAVPAVNLSASTTLSSTFSGCASLAECLATGMNQTVSFANCKLSASALNTIFTNLSANGAGKTITITGNYGAATCDISIATAKLWTVTT
jgi:hypothetical protein